MQNSSYEVSPLCFFPVLCPPTRRCCAAVLPPKNQHLAWLESVPCNSRASFFRVGHTSVGRKFAPVEGLSHDLVCTGSIYHVHFAWQVWHGQLSPRFKFNKLKSFSGVEIDQNHVDKRILGGKGFAVGRLKRHNFCPASALRKRCCIDTKRCSGGYTQPQVLHLR